MTQEMLDPGVLSRLATQMFAEAFGTARESHTAPQMRGPTLSDVSTTGAPRNGAAALPSSVAGATPHDPRLPSEADLFALPARLQSEGISLQSEGVRSGVPSPSLPAPPAIGEAIPSSGFGFLQEARSLASHGSVVSLAKPHATAPNPHTVSDPTGLVSLPAQPPMQPHPAVAPVPGSRPKSDAEAYLASINPLESLTVSPEIVPVELAGAVPSVGELSSTGFDVQAIRRDFPILQQRVNGRPLIWLDNAATTQKPQAVIDRLSRFYEQENSNIHRAAHTLAARATDAYEGAREKVRRFLNASTSESIIFVRGTTEGINLVAQSWGKRHINKGDEIVVSWLEHHANIVPWQMLAAEKGAKLRVIPIDDSGQIILEEFERLLNPRTKLVAVAHVSNALGTITPVREIREIAHRFGAKVLIDGAQSVSHMPVDVQAIGADFYVFSGHKVFAPTGIGVVYGHPDVLAQTPPWQGGGNMIADVTFEKTVYQPPPFRYEAGTGSIGDAAALGAALDYITKIGMHRIDQYEHELLVYATEALRQIPGLKIIGNAKNKASVISFVFDGIKTEEVGAALDKHGIAVRSGHHCAQPALRRYGVESTVRPSLAFYNTCEEVDALVAAIWNIKSGRTPMMT
jgi:cysteine desulfurase/selenocysteine lyase